ncbi:VWA domain-containing protein [Azotobacter chroococcum]|uniref:VWA domain-containing protein n=1 Tax=Azotobacter chroococcum TaxID=353 RepID=UPI00103AFE8D|nr:VWA domain-containing protein [Azotobacter chroococcum]TBW02036.1 VWA domain-containing protein [Azotobacter chroococcum]
MLNITPGQRLPLSSLTTDSSVKVAFQIQSGQTIDLICFSLDATGKLSDDRYTVFYNQPEAPGSCISLDGSSGFRLHLTSIPAHIDKLVFCAAIDGAGAMSQIGASRFTIADTTGIKAGGDFSGRDFASERAVMLVEVYRKSGQWRFTSVMQGFNAGMDGLVKHFGGQVSAPAPTQPATPTPAPVPAPNFTRPAPPATSRLSLEKKVAQQAPALLNLAKKAQLSLEKNKLTEIRARVGLVLDNSGSMYSQYSDGEVQQVVNRVLPLAVAFDDDGELDCWAFADKATRLSPVTLQNYANFIKKESGGWQKWKVGDCGNNEPAVLKMVMEHYRSSGDRTPAYIIFISDGGIYMDDDIARLLKEAAKLPIFWQFVGIGGDDYGVLERLDTMKGRVIDNCNFFALDDLGSVSEQELYDRLMAEFPSWLNEAKSKGIIN